VVNAKNPIDATTAPATIAKMSIVQRSASRDTGIKIAAAKATAMTNKAK
jgi:hypothetical protein